MIGELRGLKKLYLSGNKLRALPSSVGQLTALARIYLDDNRLSWLPAQMHGLQQAVGGMLEHCDLTGNPLQRYAVCCLGWCWLVL